MLSDIMCDDLHEEDIKSLSLSKDWRDSIRHAVLNAIGILRLAVLASRELLIQEGDVSQARIHRLESDVALLREELRIVAVRMNRIRPHRRPQLSLSVWQYGCWITPVAGTLRITSVASSCFVPDLDARS